MRPMRRAAAACLWQALGARIRVAVRIPPGDPAPRIRITRMPSTASDQGYLENRNVTIVSYILNWNNKLNWLIYVHCKEDEKGTLVSYSRPDFRRKLCRSIADEICYFLYIVIRCIYLTHTVHTSLSLVLSILGACRTVS